MVFSDGRKGDSDWIVAVVMAVVVLSVSALLIYPFGDSGGITGAVSFGVASINTSASNNSYFEEENGSKAGTALASGDFNNDGLNDLLIGAYNFQNGTGKVYLIYRPLVNGSNNLSTANASFLGGELNESLGYAIAAGDVNNDGYDDMLLGARWKDNPSVGSDTGGAYLIYGNATLNGSLLVNNSNVTNATFYGGASGDYTGSAVFIGNVDGDAYDDVIVGSPNYDSPSLPTTDGGRISVFLGPVANGFPNMSADINYSGFSSSDNFGTDIVVGDINGDAAADLIVGSAGNDAVYVFFGPITAGDFDTSTASVIFNGTPGSKTGDHNTLSVGDVNNDSIDDLLIGSPYDTRYGGSFSGRAYLIYGNSSLSGTVTLNNSVPQFIPEVVDDNLGYSTLIFDHNNDTYDDVLIGAPGNDEGGSLAGKIYLFYGPVNNSVYNVSSANESWVGTAANQGLGLVRQGSFLGGPVEDTGGFATVVVFPPPPETSFTASVTSGTASFSVDFTDTSTGDITDWAWDFDGDNVIDSTEQNPSNTFTTAGTYTVSLTVTGPGGSDVSTTEITANAAPSSGGGGGGGGGTGRPSAHCGDGRDNDDDGLIDYPDDPGCKSKYDIDETDVACVQSWTCTSWSECDGAWQTRTCIDGAQCEERLETGEVDWVLELSKPIEAKECAIPEPVPEPMPKVIEPVDSCMQHKYVSGVCMLECLSAEEVDDLGPWKVNGDFKAKAHREGGVFEIAYSIPPGDYHVLEIQFNKEAQDSLLPNFLNIFNLGGEYSEWFHALEFNDVKERLTAGLKIDCGDKFDPDGIRISDTNGGGLITPIDTFLPDFDGDIMAVSDEFLDLFNGKISGERMEPLLYIKSGETELSSESSWPVDFLFTFDGNKIPKTVEGVGLRKEDGSIVYFMKKGMAELSLMVPRNTETVGIQILDFTGIGDINFALDDDKGVIGVPDPWSEISDPLKFYAVGDET